MWRTVSFVERFEFEFTGNISNQALKLGDVDNDEGNEFVVGSIEGDLAVFKGSGPAPWRKCSDLGMITGVVIGDIYNNGKNSLACLSSEGWFYIFDVKADGSSEDNSSSDADCDKILKPSFSQHLPANSKVLLLADVDGDGNTELAVGYSDRLVRLFRWQSSSDGEAEGGTMAVINKWQLAGQVGSITVNQAKNGKPELLVAQPGGTYVSLILGTEKQQDNGITTESGNEELDKPEFIYHPLSHVQARNPNISTVMIGGISRGDNSQTENSTYYAICSLDGTLMLIENEKMLWSILVDHQLFALSKLDVTGNGKDEVVCCSWDGQTYIVNHTKEIVRYSFDENVAGFTTGYYAVNSVGNSPCFVYATFNNKIFIYYNIKLPLVVSTNLIEVVNKDEKTSDLFRKLNIKDEDVKQPSLYRWLLYGAKTNGNT